MNSHDRKRRTREHVIADLSVNYLERQVLLCGYVIERTAHDYGIDLEIVTFDSGGRIEDGKILVQLKATDKLRFRRDGSISYRIERADLLFWLAQVVPMILIIYDAANDRAHWLYVQSYFQNRSGFNLFAAGKTITVAVPAANLLDAATVRRFARFRDRVYGQLGEVLHVESEDDNEDRSVQ